jgi:hypothetical protein
MQSGAGFIHHTHPYDVTIHTNILLPQSGLERGVRRFPICTVLALAVGWFSEKRRINDEQLGEPN